MYIKLMRRNNRKRVPDMEKNLPLYLVTGFLGAGKSTLLRRLIASKQAQGLRVGVLVNEIGAVSIDSSLLEHDGLQIIELNEGSVFCHCKQADFALALEKILDLPIDLLFIEASGIGDPFGMTDFLEQIEAAKESKEGTLSRHYDYRGAICVADATCIVDYADVLVQVRNQIQKTSFIVLNKMDVATADEQAEAHELINQLNPDAYVYETTFGQIPSELFNEQTKPDTSMHGKTTNRCIDRPANCVIDLSGTYDCKSIRAFLAAMSTCAVRQKGFFTDENSNSMYAEAVGNSISIKPFDQTSESELKQQLVLIGLNIKPFEDEITKAWKQVFPEKPCLCVAG